MARDGGPEGDESNMLLSARPFPLRSTLAARGVVVLDSAAQESLVALLGLTAPGRDALGVACAVFRTGREAVDCEENAALLDSAPGP